jgi:FHA domain
VRSKTFMCPECGEMSVRGDVCSYCGRPFAENLAAARAMPNVPHVEPVAAVTESPILWVRVTINLDRPGIPDDAVRPTDLRPRLFRLDGEVITFGWSKSQDLCLRPDKGISSTHGELVRMRDGGFAVRDVGSSNGTFVNGQDLRETDQLTPLPVGTIITLGMWTEICIVAV